MSCEACAAANIRVVGWGLDGHIGKQDPDFHTVVLKFVL
jgi:hypothetical protein